MAEKESLPKELVAASATPLVLSILARGESYGYEILQRVRELSGGRLEWTDGMLYPILHRLEEQGLVKAVWKTSEAGRKRKYYRLREAGKDAIDAQRAQWNLVNEALQASWGVRHAR
ncbi:MAG: helix-turn-helix transcriptional regulator [Labilithrix sp.]|nr:helix-turn-helix transcriptional regulator [Labilithrix sp.]